MMQLPALFTCRGLIGLALGLGAWSAQAANLVDIYTLAKQNDPIYAAARQAYQAGQERASQGLAGLLPTLNLSANVRHNAVETSVSPDADYNSRGFGLTLTQPIYRKQNLEAYQQGKLQALLAEQQFRLAEQDLILRTARAYFDLLQAQDNLATAQAQKQAIAEQLAQARRSFEVGAATIVDTHEAQARFDLITAQEVVAQSDLEVKQRALEKLIGAAAPALDTLSATAVIPTPVPADMTAWVAQAEADGLGVVAGQTAWEIAQRESARQRGGHHPTLDLEASYADIRNTLVGGTAGVDSKNTVVGLEFNLPLYQGGLVSSRVREAVANQEKARFELDHARRQAALEARQAYLGVASGQARVAALGQALVSGQSQLDSTTLGLEVGVRTRVDVLNAQQQLYATRRDLAAARYQTLVSGLQLKATAATLSEADLTAIDALLVK